MRINMEGYMYKIIKKKEKNKAGKLRVVHIWNKYDTFCGMVKTHKLKPENYWFSDVTKLPSGVCELCNENLKFFEGDMDAITQEFLRVENYEE